jgi:hypothetical protein
LFDKLLQRRAEYLAIRERTIALAESNRLQEATALTRTEFLPAYGRYKEVGDKLFEYNVRQCKGRGQSINRVRVRSVWDRLLGGPPISRRLLGCDLQVATGPGCWRGQREFLGWAEYRTARRRGHRPGAGSLFAGRGLLHFRAQ